MNRKSREREVRKLNYEAEAETYDEDRYGCCCRRVIDRIEWNMIQNGLKNSTHVLDAGCGTGRLAIRFAKIGKKAVGLDIAKNMIKVARRKAAKAGASVEFVIGDIENMPFKKSSFDGICSSRVIFHFSSLHSIFSEFARVTREKGRVVFENVKPRHYNTFLQFAKLIRFRTGHYSVDKSVKSVYTYATGEIKGLLQRHGFVVESMKSYTKLPKLITHLFICKWKLTFLAPLWEKMEKFNFGAKTMFICRNNR